MKNKIFILAVCGMAMLSACSSKNSNNSNLGELTKLQEEIKKLQDENKDLQKKNGELQEKQDEMDILSKGDWKTVAIGAIGVENTNDAVGFRYKKADVKIMNGKKVEEKERILELDFGKIFQVSDVDSSEISDANEIAKRVAALEAFKIADKFGDLTEEHKTIIKLLKNNIDDDTRFYEVLTEGEYNILHTYLAAGKDGVKGKKSGKVENNYIEHNSLKQGRKEVGLKYSDFGLWKQSFSAIDANWQQALVGNGYTTQYSYFAMGDDKNKVTVDAGHKLEKGLTFKGKTMGSVINESVNGLKDLEGDVVLSVYNDGITGKFDLDFKDWYKFSNDLNLSNFSATGEWTVDDKLLTIADNLKVHKGSEKIEDVDIKGGIFGKDKKPEEVVGTYKFKLKEDGIGKELKINGAFGAKK